MGTAHDYLGAILQRARVPMAGSDFVPDWADKPRNFKYYPDAEHMPLPAHVPEGDSGGVFTLPLLADLLRHSYGFLNRRLAPHANGDISNLPSYPQANWGRGTASGGGLYPMSVYWASGASGPVLPGVYHYSPVHHGMRRLLTGDVTGEVRAALGDAPGVGSTDQYLLLGLKFWQNAFKYNNFCYHAVTMDVGTILQTWRMLLADNGMQVDPLLWFDEERLNALLGVPSEEEGIFAAVPLPWTNPSPAKDVEAEPAIEHRPRVRYAEHERSHRILTFDLVTELHQATLIGDRRPAPSALKSAAANPPVAGRPVVDLPPAQAPALTTRQALRSRCSSFGRFSGAEPTTAAELSALLAAAASGAALPCDLAEPGAGLDLAKLYVFANHVTGVEPGAYEYDPATGRLLRITATAPGGFLQPTYFLDNYNLEQTGAVIVPTVRAAAVIDAVGDRGYRLTNAVIGAVAQATYTAAAALGLGCGVALGFDNISYIEELGLDGTGEAPLLIMMIGRERARAADYSFQIA